MTKRTKRGDNTIVVTAIGTLKNTLGPHHGNPALGTVWPGMFPRRPNPGPPPGETYSTVGYGWFAQSRRDKMKARCGIDKRSDGALERGSEARVLPVRSVRVSSARNAQIFQKSSHR